jgi:2-polyprenyl-3-methyl-5-hydroxy-6-metoxy-1,4-benzoquinol methylase
MNPATPAPTVKAPLASAPQDYYHETRAVMLPYLPERFTRVLEVGCGGGRFSEQLKGPGREVWGIEPFDVAARQAATRLDKVLVGTYESCADQLPDGYFDLVICNDVIEHMTDHDAFLEAIKKKMAPKASLVGSIPNIRYLPCLIRLVFLKDWAYEDYGVMDRTHLRFFTQKSLRRTFEQHRFKVHQMGGINSILVRGMGISPFVKFAVKAVAASMIVLSLGQLRDTRFLQFAFRLSL